MTRVLGRVTSINVRKVLWALDALGESYEREDWGLPFRDPREPGFMALNPNATVPVLVEDDGKSLWESNGLLVYLAQTRGALLPEERHELGRALQWLGWQASDLNAAWTYAVQALVRKNPDFTDPAQIETSARRWAGKMAILDAELCKGGPFIAGDTFSVADIALGLSCHRWFMTPIDRPALSAVEAYYDRLRQRPEGARWMASEFG